jgi:pyruvate formate lyase activating enzyme
MKEAGFYKRVDQQRARCLLCPHSFLLEEGERGKCRVRFNRQGKI